MTSGWKANCPNRDPNGYCRLLRVGVKLHPKPHEIGGECACRNAMLEELAAKLASETP